VLALGCDVTDEEDCRAKRWPRRWRAFGGIDVLVNNAGISHRSLLRDTARGDPARHGGQFLRRRALHACRAGADLLARRGMVIVASPASPASRR
jgi:NAD(P)-dependent dehydrogenase (short-subunit alcohol dehydrogenase family)